MGNYRNKYIKIYFWQFLGLCLNFLSMFVVTPLITNMQVVYGIYTVCISLTIFLNYADLGFLLAGEKFAAESYSQGDYKSEKGYIGTYELINGKGKEKDISQLEIARKLLMILAAYIPISVFLKIVQTAYRIRLESYKIERVGVIGSLIAILSVPFVFFNNQYDIVGYYLFVQVVNLVSCLYYIFKSKKIGYGFRNVFLLLYFDKSRFNSMKGLASGGFVSCISWLLCFEMDMLWISTLLGAQMVALYAIGRSLNNMIRSILNIIYSPYSVRFNYFVGEKDYEGMKAFYYTLVRLFGYFVVIPIVVFSLFAEPFVISWVGNDYIGAVLSVQFLIICFLPNFFSSPALSVVIALNNFKGILVVSIIQPIVFYLCVFTTIWYYDINSVAFAKWLITIVAAVYYVLLASNIFGESILSFIRKIRIFNMIIPCMIAIGISYLTLPFFFDVEKSPWDMIKVISGMVFVIILSLLSAFCIDNKFRKVLFGVVNLKNL